MKMTPITVSEFVRGYCERSGITEREFYATQIPMPDQTSPSGWAAVSNNPLSVKAHVDLYSGKPSAPEAYDTDWESCRERAARAGAVPSVGISLVSIARRTAGLLRQLDYEPNAKSENPIEVLLFDAEKVESDIKEMKKNRATMLKPHSVGRYFYASAQPVPDETDPRDAFEAVFPMPKYAKRCGAGYDHTAYFAWDAREFMNKWEGWNACRAAMLAAAPQSPGSEPATVPGKWIPVSERVPESNGVYFGWDGKRVLEVNCFFGGFSANQFIHGEITHWMPLPSAPQEVK